MKETEDAVDMVGLLLAWVEHEFGRTRCSFRIIALNTPAASCSKSGLLLSPKINSDHHTAIRS
jgi:hypothetical protein